MSGDASLPVIALLELDVQCCLFRLSAPYLWKAGRKDSPSRASVRLRLSVAFVWEDYIYLVFLWEDLWSLETDIDPLINFFPLWRYASCIRGRDVSLVPASIFAVLGYILAFKIGIAEPLILNSIQQ